MYTLTPAFGGPGCLSETISFLCGPFESPKCDANVKEQGHLHGSCNTLKQNIISEDHVSGRVAFNSLILCSPPPYLSLSPISPQATPRTLQQSPKQ